MYLMRKTYVQQWEHQRLEKRNEVQVWRGGQPRPDIDPAKVSHVIEQMGYWRKANAIHQWFVTNVQDGEDDCKDYYVSREQLKELRDLCQLVLDGSVLIPGKVVTSIVYDEQNPKGREETKPDGMVVYNPELAEERLPTTSGFFFGGTEYDEYYIQDLQHTIDIIDPILAIEDDEADYYYHSSW